MYRTSFWYLLPWITSVLLIANAFIIWEAVDSPPYGTSSHPAAFVAGLGFIIGLIFLIQLIRETVTSKRNGIKSVSH